MYNEERWNWGLEDSERQPDVSTLAMPPKTLVRFWPLLPSSVMSGSMDLQQWGSVTTKGQVHLPGLGCHLS